MHGERLAVTPYDTLVRQHFRSTVPYWVQSYGDRTLGKGVLLVRSLGLVYLVLARKSDECMGGLNFNGGAK